VLLRALVATFFSVLVTALLLAAAATWLLGTTYGMRTVIELANRFTPVTIEARGSQGALLSEFGFDELRVVAGDTTVVGTDVRARLLRLDWQPWRLDFRHLAAATLRVTVRTDPEPGLPAQDIGIPLTVTSESLRLGVLTIDVDDSPFSLLAIDTRAEAGPSGYRVEGGKVDFGNLRAELTAELQALRPFAMTGNGRLQALLQDKPIAADVKISGSLVELLLEAQFSGAARGEARAVIASFDEPEVRSLDIDVDGLDPRLWHADAPRADLVVRAKLAPDATMTRVSGSVEVVNRAPGLIEAQRIPVRSATAQVVADKTQLRFDRINAQLLQGSASGDFSIALDSGQWQGQARLANVDPARLHGALQSMHIDGELRARQAGGTINVTAELENRGKPQAKLDFDGSFTPRQVSIRSVRLALGGGYLTAAGSVELTGSRRVDIEGALRNFEPGLLVKGVDARLTGSFAADGVLAPKPAGRIRFEIADSSAYGRPLKGRGSVELDAAQQLDIDVDVAVRSARLKASGGLGAPDRKLELQLDVPAIGELLLARKADAAGALTVSGSASGLWSAPAFDLKLAGKDLRWSDHAVDRVDASASYSGGDDGAVSVASAIAGYRYAPRPKARVQSASLSVEGTLSTHAIRLQATADRVTSALVLADGGWRDEAWRGRVREASLGPPFDLRLLVPTALVAGPGRLDFGPAQFALREVRFDDVRLHAAEDGISTQGRFSDLQPGRFTVPVEGALRPVLPPVKGRTPLSLRGQWDLKLADDLINGRLLVERAGGDLYAGRGADSALGLVDVRLDAAIEANRVQTRLVLESAKNGGLGAYMEAMLEHSEEAGWRLAQDKPWLITGAFDLPTMDWLNALLSDNLRANVRLGGRLASSVRIEGTPGNPTTSGQMTGADLRVAWVEQGVRLENGRIRAHLKDDLIVIDELRFSGPPRVKPDDRRAAAAIREGDEGFVTASGQLRLRDFSGVIQVAATRLPLLQQPDRWVIASGGGNIEISATHVQVNGAFAADAGFVGLARSDLPTLSSDVVVITPGEDVESRERRVTLGFDLGIDLGPAFFLRGRGLSTRVEGALRLRGAGRGAVTAVGAIEAVDGTFEGFGQRLRIARGRLNFQGAPENPGLDILALRTGLPVEVGVTITRTAAAPLIRLHSDPPMAEYEAMSWLVLGRPPDQGGGDNLALVQAAAMMLGGTGEGPASGVVQALGFDEISIRSGTLGIASLLPARSVAGSLRSDQSSTATVAGEVITIGKTINDALSVSYQQAISDTTRFLQLNYRLSERMSVVARGGTQNALDFVYTIAFD